MQRIVFQALAEAARSGEPVVLGIISGVKGSSPQKIGAKALFHSDGRIQGTLGGGCLEAEIQQRAIQALRTGQPETFDLLLDHDFGWDDGLICGGKVFGLILPNVQRAGEKFWRELAERKTAQSWGVRGDFSIVGGSDAPLGKPLKRLGTQDAPANTPLKRGVNEIGETLSPSPAFVGLRRGQEGERESSCEGEWLYEEMVSPPCALWIAGAGHIAQAVAPLALQLDFSVTVFDDRPALANYQFFPEEVSLKADVWDKLLTLPLPEVPSFALIVTRGHRHDALVLRDWIKKPFLFLGMIGSSRKARTIFEHFLEEKFATPAELQRVACPVGIKIRSQSVTEIAVSIMAQFIDKRAELVYEKTVSPAAKFELVGRNEKSAG
jgi:xanthine dehydrogenase accessory factor